MIVHLIDGTYELFRQHFGRPGPGPYGAAVAVVRWVLGQIEGGATHLGVATDHVVESFRNDLWPGYKTSAGMPPELLAQFPVVEELLTAFGLTVWPMVEWEADDALASAARVAAADGRVERVLILTVDKDLAQCVRDGRVVQVDVRKGVVLDEAGVVAKFGVAPASIPDYLALVGDSADGFPGLPGWGAKSTAAVLARYGHLAAIPASSAQWEVPGIRNGEVLARSLRDQLADAVLFLRLATLDTDVPVGTVDDWRWRGPAADVDAVAERFGASPLVPRARALAARVSRA